MFLRVTTAMLLLSAAAMAGSKPVCPGPAARGDARCHAQVVSDEHGNATASITPAGYGPVQFRTAYSLPSNTAGKGQTIGIVDAFNDPNIESDLGVYSSTFGLPKCTTANGCFKKVNQTGGTSYPKTDAGWALEISLDVEIAHALCPNCKILLVEATSNSFANLLAAEDYARTHANIVSNSWGGTEFSSETTSGFDGHFNHTGKPITFSSGDSGFGVEYPAASRFVTAVGGTTLKLNSNNTRASETVWSGTGSGCSAFEPKPSWQKDKGCIRRTVVDVAADANPNTGAAVYDSVRFFGSAGWFKVGGTSLSSPIIASIYALAGNGSTTLDGSYPYSHLSGLFDVKVGSDGTCSLLYLCAALAGYDGPTGNGAPRGTGAF
ncbi:MAG TPA: S53 family peptidase [Terriglobales bacterium]|nr:S53 family peptidase [Terriglobales bacterium]